MASHTHVVRVCVERSSTEYSLYLGSYGWFIARLEARPDRPKASQVVDEKESKMNKDLFDIKCSACSGNGRFLGKEDHPMWCSECGGSGKAIDGIKHKLKEVVLAAVSDAIDKVFKGL